MGYVSKHDSENVSSNFQNGYDVKTCIIQKKKQHKCTHVNCHAVFLKPSKLARHMRQHTGEKPYICNEPGCTKSYASSCHLKRHMKTHDVVQTIYKCPQCSLMVFNLCNLRRHYKEQHGKDNVFCTECGEMFHKKYQLAKHRNTVHFKSIIFKCDKCVKSFPDITRLKRHKKNHEKSYPCPISGCSEVFYKWSLLRKHKGKHVIEYKCDKCDKIFFIKSHLKSHSKIHSENRTVMLCPYEECHKTYFYKSNLKQHIKISHLGKKYYCDICSIGFTAKRTLIHHIKLHYEPKIKNIKNNSNKKRNKRKDTGIPKKSVIGKLIGFNFPHNIEKLLMKRETTTKILESSDKSSNDTQVEPVECIL